MTNQEIDQIIVRGERQSLLRYFLASKVNARALFGMAILAAFAFAAQASYVAIALLIVLISIIVTSVWRKFRRHRENRRARFWNEIRKHGLQGEPPTGDTRLLIDKIVKIQTAISGDDILPMRQAVKLVAAYEQQARQLAKVNLRLAKLKVTEGALSQKIAQLQELGENHSAGSRNLEEVSFKADALQKVAGEIQSSCQRLEAILNGVRKTARARQLHHELDRLSALDSTAGETTEPAFEAESLTDIESQIGREIETYLRLERETDEQLR